MPLPPDAIAPRPPAERLEQLADRLRRETGAEVRFTDGDRALYATDGSNYRQVPLGVVVPRSVDDVVRTMAACHALDIPVLGRAGGTSLAGQGCNEAVVIDVSKYLIDIPDIDTAGRTATVQPGIVLDELNRHAARHDLMFGPDPSTHDRNCIGGMLGNNSCGLHSPYAGRTSDNIVSMDVLTYDGVRMTVGETSEAELDRIIAEGGRRGQIYADLRAIRDRYAELIRQHYPDIPRRVSGFNLDALLPEKGFNVAEALVGSEGTCAFILGATVRLLPRPPHRAVLVIGYPSVFEAADHNVKVLEFDPIGMEGIDDLLTGYMREKDLYVDKLRLLPEGKGWLLVEFGGDTPEDAAAKAQTCLDWLESLDDPPSANLLTDPADQKDLWKVREAGLPATSFVPGHPMMWPGWEDAGIDPKRLGDYLRDFRRLLDAYGYESSMYGHFGDGCVHTRISFDLTTADGIDAMRRFTLEAADMVVKYKGSLSGEHGDGQCRGDLLDRMYPPEIIEAMRAFKRAWDPDNRMNPGKVINPDGPPYGRTENLRLGAGFEPQAPGVAFSYAKDGGRFGQAVGRCIGVGKCRHHEDGVMCPSYMVTREEKHSTRGRAHLLWEMVNRPDTLPDGWKNEAVHEALDLCLACKGCKSDCPVDVDMATYKAEFYHKFYQGRRYPREAYAFGLIHFWSRLVQPVPWLANLVTQTPGVSTLAKKVGGIHPARDLPPYRRSFRRWFKGSHKPAGDGRNGRVILWPDTFNNHFRPHIAIAATQVLEALGYRVDIPRGTLCCGRALYPWGMLDRARKELVDTMDALREDAAAGVPVVGLEPACTTTFRDELPDLFPENETARRLARQTRQLSEFIVENGHLDDIPPALKGRRALVHAHCHHHAVIGLEAEVKVMDALGLDWRKLDSGCCGMAGAFGFEKDHYEVSMAAAERVLLPAVREAPDDALILTNGFSCIEQIAQGTGRDATHLAQALLMAFQASDHPRSTGGPA